MAVAENKIFCLITQASWGRLLQSWWISNKFTETILAAFIRSGSGEYGLMPDLTM